MRTLSESNSEGSSVRTARRCAPWAPSGSVVALLLGCAPGVALAGGGIVAWWLGIALSVCGLGAVRIQRYRLVNRVHREFTQPLNAACDVVDDLRGGATLARVEDAGAQPVRNLARRINKTLTGAFEESQSSQAKLVSITAAFDRMNAVLRTFTEGVFVIGKRGEIVLANPAAYAFLDRDAVTPMQGRTGDDAPPPSFAQLVVGPLRAPLERALERLDSGQSVRETRRGIQGLAAGVIVDLDVVPVDPEHGAGRFGILVVVTDVTKSFEVGRLKDEFLSSLSHELRTPLTNIVSYAEIVAQMTVQTPDAHEFLQILQSESRRLHRLVDNVLEYADIQTGKIEWNNEELALDDLVRSCFAVFAERATENEIRIECVGASEQTVCVDRHHYLQVLGNVLDNAMKFTPEGGLVRIEIVDVDGAVEVRVHDDGDGVPERERERVFDRFTQLREPVSGRPIGTGMGLAVCRVVVEHYGGRVWCEQSPLGGACFVIQTPALVAGPQRVAAPTS